MIKIYKNDQILQIAIHHDECFTIHHCHRVTIDHAAAVFTKKMIHPSTHLFLCTAPALGAGGAGLVNNISNDKHRESGF